MNVIYSGNLNLSYKRDEIHFCTRWLVLVELLSRGTLKFHLFQTQCSFFVGELSQSIMVQLKKKCFSVRYVVDIKLCSPAAKQIFHVKVCKCFHTMFFFFCHFTIVLGVLFYNLKDNTLSHLGNRDIACLFRPVISPPTGRGGFLWWYNIILKYYYIILNNFVRYIYWKELLMLHLVYEFSCSIQYKKSPCSSG